MSLWATKVLKALPWKFNCAVNLVLLSDFLSLSTIEMYLYIHVKYPSFFPDFNQILMFVGDFRKILWY